MKKTHTHTIFGCNSIKEDILFKFFFKAKTVILILYNLLITEHVTYLSVRLTSIFSENCNYANIKMNGS